MTLVNYKTIPIRENNEPLVQLNEGDFELYPAYFHMGHTSDKNMFLRKGVIELLKVVSKDIHPYRLKIWDGFRPRVLQQILHDKITNQFRIQNPDWDEDKLYIESGKYITPANEEGRIPPHLTGGSVDLTMIDQNGEELDMGTIFDHFGIEASYNFKDLPENVLENRKFLRDSMTKVGFRADNEEWWHFDYGNQLWAFDLNKEFAFYGVGVV